MEENNFNDFDFELAQEIAKKHNVSSKVLWNWKKKKKIPNVYLKIKAEKQYKGVNKKLQNAETRKLQQILNLPEIRSGRLPTKLKASTLSYFKNGITNSILEEEFLNMKIAINTTHILLSNFSKMEVKATQNYFFQLLDLSVIPFLNWSGILRNVDVKDRPSEAYMRWSLYNEKRRPNEMIISTYSQFFEQLRFELKKLAFELKI